MESILREANVLIRDFRTRGCGYRNVKAWKNKLYQVIRDVYCMQTRAAFVGSDYANLECFTDPMRFPEKLLEKA